MTTASPLDQLLVAVDPGGRESGIVVLYGEGLYAAAVLDRAVAVDPRHGYSAAAWAAANVEAVHRLASEALTVVVPMLGLTEPIAASDLPRVRLAIENYHAPNPHVTRDDGDAIINLDGILDTALVVGQLLGEWPDAILVEPGGNGALPPGRGHYPPPIDARPGAAGRDRLRHARSAYDVARAARGLAGRLHDEAHRAARVVEPVLYRAQLTRPTPSVGSNP